MGVDSSTTPGPFTIHAMTIPIGIINHTHGEEEGGDAAADDAWPRLLRMFFPRFSAMRRCVLLLTLGHVLMTTLGRDERVDEVVLESPDYSLPPSAWRRRRAEPKNKRTDWSPSVIASATVAPQKGLKMPSPDGESGGDIIAADNTSVVDPDHAAAAKYADGSERGVKAGHLRGAQGAGKGGQNEQKEGDQKGSGSGTGSAKAALAKHYSPEQVRQALLHATGLDVKALAKSTESTVKTQKGKELCKMASTLHLFFKQKATKEVKEVTAWYHRLKSTEPALWRIVRCAKDFPSLKYNDVTSCFRHPRETFLQLAKNPAVAMEMAKVLAEKAPNDIKNVHAVLDDVCRAFLGDLASVNNHVAAY